MLVFRSDAQCVDTENMNPEDLYNSIKKTSADIQNLSRMDSQYSDSRRDSRSHDGQRGDDGGAGSAEKRRQYNPNNYQDEVPFVRRNVGLYA